jgi:hypothetical protein
MTGTLRDKAIGALVKREILSEGSAIAVVDVVLAELGEPDAEMLDAGSVELHTAFGSAAAERRYRRAMSRVVWHAMFDRVRR